MLLHINRLRRIKIMHHVKRIEFRQIHLMSAQNSLRKCALQRCKKKNAFRISLENELDGTIAKPAHAVIQKNRMSFHAHLPRPQLLPIGQHLSGQKSLDFRSRFDLD